MFTLQTRNSTGVWQTWERYETLGDALRAASVMRSLWPCGTWRVTHNSLETNVQEQTMFTRKEYMDGAIGHEEYYAQFVNENVKRVVNDAIRKVREADDSWSLSTNVCIAKVAARMLKAGM